MTFSRLQSLSIFTSRISPLLLASGLEAPALCTVDLACDGTDGWTTEQREGLGLEAQRYVEAFGTQLTDVSFYQCIPDDSMLLAVLGQLGHVEQLSVTDVPTVLTCDIFARLTPGGAGGPEDDTQGRRLLCPNVWSLNLEVVGKLAESVEQRTVSALALMERRIAHGIKQLKIGAGCWTIVRPKGERCRNTEWEEQALSKEEREMFDEMDANKKVFDRYVIQSGLLGMGVQRSESPLTDMVGWAVRSLWEVEHTIVYPAHL